MKKKKFIIRDITKKNTNGRKFPREEFEKLVAGVSAGFCYHILENSDGALRFMNDQEVRAQDVVGVVESVELVGDDLKVSILIDIDVSESMVPSLMASGFAPYDKDFYFLGFFMTDKPAYKTEVVEE